MAKKSTSKKPLGKKTAKKTTPSLTETKINRRQEWRFELPLPGIAEGKLPKGKIFKEVMTLDNISSGGAFFCLDSGIIVGSKINLVLALPDKLGKGKKLNLRLGGITVRLEEVNKKGKKRGVAISFSENYKIIPVIKSKKVKK